RIEPAVLPFEERRLLNEGLGLPILHHLISVLVVNREDDEVARAAHPRILYGRVRLRRDVHRADHGIGDDIRELAVYLGRRPDIEVASEGRVLPEPLLRDMVADGT